MWDIDAKCQFNFIYILLKDFRATKLFWYLFKSTSLYLLWNFEACYILSFCTRHVRSSFLSFFIDIFVYKVSFKIIWQAYKRSFEQYKEAFNCEYMDNVNINVTSSQTFLVYNFSPNSTSKGRRRRAKGEGCECQSHVEARKCSRPTPLSGRVPSCGFCKMLADHTAPREQASLDYLSPPFQLSNWKWRHAGSPPVVLPSCASRTTIPHSRCA